MADVNALFASRKSKKGKNKKKSTNANKIMVERETNPNEDMHSQDEGLLELGMDGLEGGNWVDSDDDDDRPDQGTNFLMQGSKKGIANLDINEYNRMMKGEPAQEENTNDFQWSSKNNEKDEEEEAEMEEAPAEEVLAERRVYRPREMLAAKAKADGSAALKQLDNEEVFPTLGGAAAAASVPKKSAWGAPAPKPKKPKAKYLGEDFIAAETCENEKPGYRFGSGENGTGYYWDGPAKAKEKALNKEKPSIPAPTAEPEKTSEPAPISEPEPSKESELNVFSAPVAIGDAKDKFSELAGLKKKKKKKKKTEVAAE
mmetsp:Transcript_17339/g.20836  ORF Transcript_17339/g.20836 Transcript_17339/m.20836 type:complete len:315 (-) Transcript_17339:9-953(-)|eukprot:CAMPEP_0204828012 /NCGR_PEP_ID=MMETSP1346-20131115/5580_1 /ASSEMBLY_ACC=CAM_ASM_000771 /TAXON_ID=215587 /ORGANISM="Aplanochytrium stocchinoi, Strain GSBS06" /LENGTH=314 /DNA_ID=CAMNT_0051956749 /DNA_START=67 /DNA_END=1011 /DNA_ORIENTATION=+